MIESTIRAWFELSNLNKILLRNQQQNIQGTLRGSMINYAETVAKNSDLLLTQLDSSNNLDNAYRMLWIVIPMYRWYQEVEIFTDLQRKIEEKYIKIFPKEFWERYNPVYKH